MPTRVLMPTLLRWQEVVSDGHGGVKRIDDLIADDDKLKATWLALKDKTPHNVQTAGSLMSFRTSVVSRHFGQA